MKFNRKKYMRKYNKKYYQENKEKILEGNRIWRDKNKERKKVLDKKWISKNQHTEKYKKSKKEMSKKLRKKYPEKLIARNKARYLKNLPSQCEKCGSNKKLEKHHPNYSQPRKVIILCRSCHRNAEARIKTEQTRREKVL